MKSVARLLALRKVLRKNGILDKVLTLSFDLDKNRSMDHDQQEAMRNLIAYRQLQELQKMNGSQPQNNSSGSSATDVIMEYVIGIFVLLIIVGFIIAFIADLSS
jgi:hypothetical protein